MKSPRTNRYLLAALLFGLMSNASAEVYADSDAAWAITDHYAKKHGMSYEDAKDELVESGYFKTRTRRSSANTAQAEQKETPKPVAKAEAPAPAPFRYEEVAAPAQASTATPQKNTTTTPKPHKTTAVATIVTTPAATTSVVASSRTDSSDVDSDSNSAIATTKTLAPATSAAASTTPSTVPVIATITPVNTTIAATTAAAPEEVPLAPSTQSHAIDTRMWQNAVLIGFALLILTTLARFFFNRRKPTSHIENPAPTPEVSSVYAVADNTAAPQLLTPQKNGSLVFYGDEDEQLAAQTFVSPKIQSTKVTIAQEENTSEQQMPEALVSQKTNFFSQAIQKSLSNLATVHFPAVISQVYAVHQSSKNISLQTTVRNQLSGYAARRTELNSLYAFKHLHLQSH